LRFTQRGDLLTRIRIELALAHCEVGEWMRERGGIV
jgi:hypothetical protein